MGVEGTIDGMPLPSVAAENLYAKYGLRANNEARFRQETSGLEDKARKEVEQSENEFKESKESKKEESKKVESILKELKDKGLM